MPKPCTLTPVRKRRQNIKLISVATRQLGASHYSQARLTCQQILAVDSKHLGALEILARANWHLQSYPEVIQLTARLIEINPFEPGYFALRGMALRAIGQYGEAAKCLARDPAAENSLIDVEVFQSRLVADLIQSDAKFAAHYHKDAPAALAEKGLHIRSGKQMLQLVTQSESRVKNYTKYC